MDNTKRDITFPNWLSINNKIEQGLQLASRADTLYHYTSIDGFRSILTNRDFWLSNIHFMNDKQEFKDGMELCSTIIDELLQISDKCYIDYLCGIKEALNKKESQGFFKIYAEDIFGLSFCNDGDLLTQWNMYGNNGIAIGFAMNPSNPFDQIALMHEKQYEEEIKQNNPLKYPHDEIRLFPMNVIYNKDTKKKTIMDIIKIGMDFICEYGQECNEMSSDGVSDTLFYYFTYMKNEAFSHEKESRFIYYLGKNKNNMIDYRERNGIILPYLKFKILDVNCIVHKEIPINEIVVGPSEKIDYIVNSIKYFLKKSGFEYLIDKVKVSNIPYRS